MNDGLGLLSRFSSLLTVGFISFYIAAIFVENWSSAEDQVNTVLDAGSTTTGVDLATFTTLNTTDYTYSLDTYCVDTPIPSWNLAVRTKSKGVVQSACNGCAVCLACVLRARVRVIHSWYFLFIPIILFVFLLCVDVFF